MRAGWESLTPNICALGVTFASDACWKITLITDTCATVEYAVSMPCALDLATCSNP